jgi:hypothetical protein
MSELRKVSYTLTGDGAPVIRLECRTVQEAQQQRQVAGITYEQAKEAYFNTLETFIRSPKLKTTYSLTDRVVMWADCYIQCGACKRAWSIWFADNPIVDIDEWLVKVKEKIESGGWL